LINILNKRQTFKAVTEECSVHGVDENCV